MIEDEGKSALIGISGGIGAGKSMLSRLLRLRGFMVYDCDKEAARIMNEPSVAHQIANEFGEDVLIEDGVPDRKKLAGKVFSNPAALRKLEAIIHPAVREDLSKWHDTQPTVKPVFVESAILAQSGLVNLCAGVWYVDAPEDVRIERVEKRSGLTRSEICKRMEAQAKEVRMLRQSGVKVCEIINVDTVSMIDRVNQLLRNQQQTL